MCFMKIFYKTKTLYQFILKSKIWKFVLHILPEIPRRMSRQEFCEARTFAGRKDDIDIEVAFAFAKPSYAYYNYLQDIVHFKAKTENKRAK